MRDPLYDFLTEKKREMQETLKQQSSRSKEAIDELEARCLMLSAQKLEAGSRAASLEAENTQLHNKIQSLELEIVSKERMILPSTQAVGEVNALRVRVADLECELESALKGWKDIEMEKAAENNILLRKIASLEQEVIQVDNSNSRYIQETAEHSSSLEQKLQLAQRDLDIANANYRDKCAEVNSLKAKLQNAIVGWNTSDNSGNIALTNQLAENDALRKKILSLENQTQSSNYNNQRVTELEQELERALQGWMEADRCNVQNIELQKQVLQLEAALEERDQRRLRDEKQLEQVLEQLSLGDAEQVLLKQQKQQQLIPATPEPTVGTNNNVGMECAMLRRANQELERQLIEAKQNSPNMTNALFDTQNTLDVLRGRFEGDIKRLETEVASRDNEILYLQHELRHSKLSLEDRLLESPEFV